MKVSESGEASASPETFILERSVADLFKMTVSEAGEAFASSESSILKKSVAVFSKLKVSESREAYIRLYTFIYAHVKTKT